MDDKGNRFRRSQEEIRLGLDRHKSMQRRMKQNLWDKVSLQNLRKTVEEKAQGLTKE